ncbi:hypothetical protein V0288_17785 [Pannus brasiliensis CCIBt3594]|uniref:Uncharacterized protein n=1 Tax=Pannus brasiliensis CCIBt3594 TaxID=1427578 RepID=A0AAW9QZ75_9CHRO
MAEDRELTGTGTEESAATEPTVPTPEILTETAETAPANAATTEPVTGTETVETIPVATPEILTETEEIAPTNATVTGTETVKTIPVATPETVTATKTVPVPTPGARREPNPVMKRILATRESFHRAVGEFTPRWRAYWKQWPRTFLVWFLLLLCLSLLVWRFLPGDVTVGTYTPAQGLFIPITVFGGPLIIALFIATHGGLETYSNTVAVKGIGLRLIDFFFKVSEWAINLLPSNRARRENISPPTNGIVDLPFPGLGFQGFLDRYILSDTVSSARVVETVSRYQLQNLGTIAVNFLIVYILIKLPAIVLWETLSLSLEWGVYKLGFWMARVPFPPLTIYHWELFFVENIAVAFVIFFQEVKLDTAKTTHIDEESAAIQAGEAGIHES